MGRAEERTNYILDRLAREGEVSVAQLASDLGVSPVTVRASLKTLDEQGAPTAVRAPPPSVTFTCARTIVSRSRNALLAPLPT